jgi:hypothetical protein
MKVGELTGDSEMTKQPKQSGGWNKRGSMFDLLPDIAACADCTVCYEKLLDQATRTGKNQTRLSFIS